MTQFLFRRSLNAAITVFLILVLVFVAARIGGDPVSIMFPDGIDPETQAAFEAQLGLDKPVLVQFSYYMLDLAQGEFGNSIHSRESVIDMYLDRLPATLTLAALAFVLSVFMGIGLGLIGALRRNAPSGRLAMSVAFLGYSVPHFVLAILLIFLFGFVLRTLPTVGNSTPYHYVLPAIVLAAGLTAAIARYTRSVLLDVLSEDYVRTARSKGLSDQLVHFKHALPNALIPVVTVLGLQLTSLVSGSLIVEEVFAFRGIGQLLVGSVRDADFPVLQCGVIFFGLAVILINLLVDVLYAVLDPRVRVAS
ncbi:MAG: ABC transporter permease [Paracoccaceae bacterium]|nr:ABC transporter permease [Paracoccaceae bacterium]MDE2913098.1 ABC transporter permease [Paracoccaceae bacterium]